MKQYRSALDRLKRAEDGYGRAIWIEKVGRDGRPDVYYKYDSKGRLMKHTQDVWLPGHAGGVYEVWGSGRRKTNSE